METMVTHRVKLTPECLEVDGQRVAEAVAGESFLTQLYRKYGMGYPKFFKMDVLCRVGLIASELLLAAEGGERFVPRADRAVILFNRNTSLHADRSFQATIADAEDFYPSPSVFVYTLPNIVTGEIAIRHKIGGETSFLIFPDFAPERLERIAVQTLAANPELKHLICGWVDYDEERCDVRMFLYQLVES